MNAMNTSVRPIYTFAADFDCGTYGSGNYNEECTPTQATGTPDTGVVALVGAPYFILGGVLLVAAIVLAVLMQKRKKH